MKFFRTLLGLLGMIAGIGLAIPLVMIWLVLWAVSGITKLTARLFEPAALGSDQLVQFTPIVGWRPRPNLDGYYLTMVRDSVFHVLTDSEGWPDTQQVSDTNVLVFGDSYAFGYGVDTRATFWRYRSGVRVKAIGAPGYNMVQELLVMRELTDRLSGKLVIWFIYFGNDLYDNLFPNNRHYRTPFVRLRKDSQSWEIATQHVSPKKWPNGSTPDYYAKLAELCCATFLSDRAYSACEFLLGEAKKTCEAAGARLVLMTIPDVVQLTESGQNQLAACAPNRESFDPNRPDKRFSEIASCLGLTIVPLTMYLTATHYKQKDPHWNHRGHEKVAELIEQTWKATVPDRDIPGDRLRASQSELVPAASTL
jgi:hypothetical protein